MFTRFLQFDLQWPQITFDCYYLMILCLRAVFKENTIWPMVGSNDLPLPQKSIGFFTLIWNTYVPSMRFTVSVLKISCFHSWPLVTPNDLDLHLNSQDHTPAMYEITTTYLSQDIMVTRFWPIDLLSPQLTIDLHQNNRNHPWSMDNPHAKYISHCYPSWDIVFTRFDLLTSWDSKWPLNLDLIGGV